MGKQDKSTTANVKTVKADTRPSKQEQAYEIAISGTTKAMVKAKERKLYTYTATSDEAAVVAHVRAMKGDPSTLVRYGMSKRVEGQWTFRYAGSRDMWRVTPVREKAAPAPRAKADQPKAAPDAKTLARMTKAELIALLAE